MAKTNQQIIDAGNVIKNETVPLNNTAERIGTQFVDQQTFVKEEVIDKIVTDFSGGDGKFAGAVETKAINDFLQSGYIYKGIATPTTVLGTPDGNVFYLSTQPGVYSNFNSYTSYGGLTMHYWNGSWVSVKIDSDIELIQNYKMYNSNWNYKGRAVQGMSTPADVLYHIYVPTENGTIFGKSITDYKTQVLVGSGSTGYSVETIRQIDKKLEEKVRRSNDILLNRLIGTEYIVTDNTLTSVLQGNVAMLRNGSIVPVSGTYFYTFDTTDPIVLIAASFKSGYEYAVCQDVSGNVLEVVEFGETYVENRFIPVPSGTTKVSICFNSIGSRTVRQTKRLPDSLKSEIEDNVAADYGSKLDNLLVNIENQNVLVLAWTLGTYAGNGVPTTSTTNIRCKRSIYPLSLPQRIKIKIDVNHLCRIVVEPTAGAYFDVMSDWFSDGGEYDIISPAIRYEFEIKRVDGGVMTADEETGFSYEYVAGAQEIASKNYVKGALDRFKFGRTMPSYIDLSMFDPKYYSSLSTVEGTPTGSSVKGEMRIKEDNQSVTLQIIQDNDFGQILRQTLSSALYSGEHILKIATQSDVENTVIIGLNVYDENAPFILEVLNGSGNWYRYYFKDEYTSYQNSYYSIEALNNYGVIRYFKIKTLVGSYTGGISIRLILLPPTSSPYYVSTQTEYDLIFVAGTQSDSMSLRDKYVLFPKHYKSNWIDKNLFILGDSNTPMQFVAWAKHMLGTNVYGNWNAGYSIRRTTKTTTNWLYEHSRQLFMRDVVKSDLINMAAYVFFVSYNDNDGGGELSDAAIKAVLDNYPNMSDDVSEDAGSDYYKKLNGGTLSNGTTVTGWNNLTDGEVATIFGYKQVMAALIRQIFSLYAATESPYVFLTTIQYSIGTYSSDDSGIDAATERAKRQSINSDINEISDWFGGVPVIDVNKGAGYALGTQGDSTDLHFTSRVKSRLGKFVASEINKYQFGDDSYIF